MYLPMNDELIISELFKEDADSADNSVRHLVEQRTSVFLFKIEEVISELQQKNGSGNPKPESWKPHRSAQSDRPAG